MAVANSDASSLLGGWSFRKDNLSRSLSHFVNLKIRTFAWNLRTREVVWSRPGFLLAR